VSTCTGPLRNQRTLSCSPNLAWYDSSSTSRYTRALEVVVVDQLVVKIDQLAGPKANLLVHSLYSCFSGPSLLLWYLLLLSLACLISQQRNPPTRRGKSLGNVGRQQNINQEILLRLVELCQITVNSSTLSTACLYSRQCQCHFKCIGYPS
jgi:hypothetical protein